MAAPGAGASAFSKLSLPARIALGVGAVGILGVSYWGFGYTEVSAKIEYALRQQSALRADFVAQQQAQASYFADRDEFALRQQRQREFNKVLPSDTEAAAFLSSLQQVSNISGIDLKAWQPMEEQQQAFFAKVPMKLEMSGKYHQLVKFMHEVGKLDRIINIENIELLDPKTTSEDVILRARCLATAFHTVAAKGAAAQGGPQK